MTHQLYMSQFLEAMNQEKIKQNKQVLLSQIVPMNNYIEINFLES